MRVIEVDSEGSVIERNGDPDYWMTPDTVWASTEYPADEKHEIYYNDEAMSDPGQVRIKIQGVELPLPLWITGKDGEKTGEASKSIKEVERDINITG